MICHILAWKETAGSRSTAQQVPYLEPQLDEVKQTVKYFNDEISKRFKHDHGYKGQK